MKTRMNKLTTIATIVAALTFATQAYAQPSSLSEGVVRIGVMTDMSSLYSDFSGKGSVEAVKMAVEDFGGKVLGKPIEVISADHQNKTDVAAAKAREWFDNERVDIIVDLVSSGVALAVNEVGRQMNKLVVVSAAYTNVLTEEQCAPYTIHYQADSAALTSTPRILVKQGADSWFFLTADYAFGHTMERQATEAIKSGGGKVVGSTKHPLNAADFSSFLLLAQASGAKIVGLANAGGDTINAIKAANEFGLTRSGKQSLVAMKVFESDVGGMGLPIAQGLYTTVSFYWDRDAASRTWAERFNKRVGKMPSEVHAADYSATMHYLKAISAAGTDETKSISEKMRTMKVNDFFATNGTIREDGLLVKDLYLVQVKKPAESKRAWDFFKIISTIPSDQAYAQIQKSRCPLLKK